jgi:hypothetical protein
MRQIRLHVIHDDPSLSTEAVLRREAVGSTTMNSLASGIWWVDGVAEARVAAWITEIQAMAERVRHDPPARRSLLAILVPQDVLFSNGLDVVAHRAEPLGRMDLEVAARYAATAAGEVGPLGRLRVELAVEMASAFLPRTKSLDILDHWMAAPKATLCDPGRFAEHGTAVGVEILSPEFELWRAQHAVLLGEIERLRLQIVRTYPARWKIPYLAPEADGRPPRMIEAAEFLELKHLCAQLRDAGEPFWSPLRQRLQALRELRNSLSHLEHVALAEVGALETELCG